MMRIRVETVIGETHNYWWDPDDKNSDGGYYMMDTDQNGSLAVLRNHKNMLAPMAVAIFPDGRWAEAHREEANVED